MAKKSSARAEGKKSAKTSSAEDVIAITELQGDKRNARRRTDRGRVVIEQSLRKLGAGRSILIDGDGVVRAGNGTLEGAVAAGIKKVRVIKTDGKELIAVQRTDLKGAAAIEMGLVDNRSAELAEWDTETLAELTEELKLGGKALDDLGFTDDELDRIIAGAETPAVRGHEESASPDQSGAIGEKFQIVLTCVSEQQQRELLARFKKEKLLARPLIS